MRHLLVVLCLLVGLYGRPALAVAPAPPPAPITWVTDGSGLLSAEVREQLDRRLEAYQRGTGHQVLVWIGLSTGGTPLEDWTVKAFAAWKVGRKGLDDGLVLFVFTADHTLRMEVGYGLEGQVPDLVANRILQETILPRLKTGDGNGAIRAGVDRILQTVGGTSEAAQSHAPRRGGATSLSPGTWILIVIVGIGFLILLVTNPGLAIWLLFNVLSGGRGGGGGGGGGGWSGGGGRSGGGGASGSW